MITTTVVFSIFLAPAQVVPPAPAPPVIILGGARFGAAFQPAIGTSPIPAMAAVTTPTPQTIGGPGDEGILRNARIGVTDEQLLEFFRQRTPPAPSRERLLEAIRKLGSRDASERDAAQGQLTAVGPAAIPMLRTASNRLDEVETATRARTALNNIEGTAGATLVTHAARLLGSRKPAGAARALIAYLPHTESETTFQEVELALVAVALRDGKPDPALLQALTDPTAVRRGTAAQVLCRAAGSQAHGLVRPLLEDARASVRLKTALALVDAEDARAVQVLIDLLGVLPTEDRKKTEDYLSSLAGEWAVAGPRGNDAMSARLRKEVWSAWWKSTDGPRLLDEFRSRSGSDEDYLQGVALIHKFADERPAVRESALQDLVKRGKVSIPLLRRALAEGQSSIVPHAVQCLENLEGNSSSPLPAVASRLLKLRRPEGSVAALLGYLPFCESATSEGQVIEALAILGCPQGKPDEALLRGLSDRLPIRRGVVAQVLCQARATEQLPAVRKLLEDSDAMVRVRVARGLALAGQKVGVAALIGQLRELPLEQAYEAEDFLVQLAGDRAPREEIEPDPRSRTRAVEAWTKWWSAHQASVDLAALFPTPRTSGHRVIVENWNPALGKGRCLEVDGSGKIIWEIRDLNWPNSAQKLPQGHVLVIEQQARVSERDTTGKVTGLDLRIPQIFHAERLRNGNYFLACRHQLLMLDPKGAQLFTYPSTGHTILAARRFRDGSMAYLTTGGNYVRLDRGGKKIREVGMADLSLFSPAGAEILPGDRVVVADSRYGKVVEWSAEGKVAWECSIQNPLAPTLSGRGTILVAGNNQQSIYEIDRTGKVVQESKGLAYRPFRVYRSQ